MDHVPKILEPELVWKNRSQFNETIFGNIGNSDSTENGNFKMSGCSKDGQNRIHAAEIGYTDFLESAG